MTFYEAAIQILLREGRPLHAREITELALQENLLSHVGKQPEVVMASRLAAMARRSHDKRLVAVAEDTFGLTDWNLVGDPEALEASGIIQLPQEASQPPLRGLERHPKISKDNVRILGRGERRRREEAQRRRKRAPRTLTEIVLDLLEAAKMPLPLFDLAAALREKDLVEDDLGREALEAKLHEENQRREGDGKDPAFAFPEGGWVGLPGAEPEGEEAALEALEQAMARLSRGRRQRVAPVEEEIAVPAIDKLVQQSREAAVRQVRRRLEALDATALEGMAQVLFDELGYREVRVAKRHREGAFFTMRRRMGLTEIRTGVRVLRGGRDVLREDVQELRKDLQAHSAQMGVLLSPADPTREARAEAAQAGQGLVLLLCADALADQLVERGIGASVKTVTWVEFDPRSFASFARRAGKGKDKRETAEERRERRDQERKEAREKRQRAREEREAKRQVAQEAEVSGGGESKEEVLPGEQAEATAPAKESKRSRPARRGRRRGAAAAAEAEAGTGTAETAEAEAEAVEAKQPATPEPTPTTQAPAVAAEAAEAAAAEPAAADATSTPEAPQARARRQEPSKPEAPAAPEPAAEAPQAPAAQTEPKDQAAAPAAPAGEEDPEASGA